MDSLTQATLGAAVGHLFWRQGLGRKSVLLGGVIGTIPDLDIIIYPLLDQVQRLYWHRGESHSLFFILLAPIITAWFLQKYISPNNIGFSRLYCGAFFIYLTHVLIDLFTVYGTQLLAPISRMNYGIGNMFIIDPLFTLPLLIGLGFTLGGRKNMRARANHIGLGIACCYGIWSLTLQAVADDKLRNSVRESGYTITRHFTSAGPFTTFLWRHLAETEDGYLLGYWSVFDGNKPVTFHYIPKNSEAIAAIYNSRSFRAIRWFSRGWWCVMESENGNARVVDLRFTEIPSSAGGNHQQWDWPFAWNFRVDGDNDQLRSVAPTVDAPLTTLGLLSRRVTGGEGWLSTHRDPELQASLPSSAITSPDGS